MRPRRYAASHRMILLWRGEFEILVRSKLWGIQSKALEKSMAAARVLAGGSCLLKPMAILVESFRREEVVECMGLKPC